MLPQVIPVVDGQRQSGNLPRGGTFRDAADRQVDVEVGPWAETRRQARKDEITYAPGCRAPGMPNVRPLAIG